MSCENVINISTHVKFMILLRVLCVCVYMTYITCLCRVVEYIVAIVTVCVCLPRDLNIRTLVRLLEDKKKRNNR